MNDLELKKFTALFVETARQYLATLEAETTLANVSHKDTLAELHIAAHSLKGQAYAMQYLSFAEASKRLEFLLKTLIDGTITLNDAHILSIHLLLKGLRESLDSIEWENHEEDLTEQIKRFEEQFASLHISW